MFDLERLDNDRAADFANRVVQSWSTRDNAIAAAGRIRSQNWTVQVPEAFKFTAKTQHSSMVHDVANRTRGILTAQLPVFERVPPDHDVREQDRANTVERYCQGRLAWDIANAMVGRDAWDFLADQIGNKGAGCVGSIYAPHAWASAPALWDEDGRYRKALWRDSRGEKTGDENAMDHVATAKHYVKVVELYRMAAKPPIQHRYIPTEQTYPYAVGDELAAMVIRRRASVLELAASGLDTKRLGRSDTDVTVDKTFDLTELWTPNRCRYFIDDAPLRHLAYGEDGIHTGYGFVPFSYRIGMPGAEEAEFGPLGMGVIEMVSFNLVMLDYLETFQYNAIHGYAFPTYQVIRQLAADTLEGLAAGEPKYYTVEPGKIVDFGVAGIKLEELSHSGLNKDFYKMIESERAELRTLIPDVLHGIPANSGFNTTLAETGALKFFRSMISALEHMAKAVAVMDLRHIADRLPGKLYLDYRHKESGIPFAPTRLRRVGIDARDIGDYYGLEASISRELDRVTMGNWALGMMEKGIFSPETVAAIAGVTDWPEEERKIAIARFKARPDIRAVVEQDAVVEFGLQSQQEAAAAAAQIQVRPDGLPLVLPPPQPQSPEGQGPVGAIMGGMNPASTGANMGSVGNANIGLPTPEQPARARRRGGRAPGANPGAPQLQNGTALAAAAAGQ